MRSLLRGFLTQQSEKQTCRRKCCSETDPWQSGAEGRQNGTEMMKEKTFKSGFVGIVGRPNVGKSTLMNHLVGQKIAITSSRPQTTRSQIRTVYTCEKGQIVFLDTPGIHKAENRLGEYMDDVAFETLSQVDVILWLVEPTSFSGAGERFIASRLKLQKKPVILVMNKIDTVDKKDVPQFMEMYRRLYPFDEIIPVSALRSVNIDSILEAVFAHLPEGPMYYDEETVTDQTMRALAAEIIREKALRCLKEEVPHGIAVEILSMKERERKKNGRESGGSAPPELIWDIEAVIITEKESHKGIIIGKGGSMLKRIATQARLAIEEMAQEHVNLKVFVKVRKDWRDNAGILRSLGYDLKSL